MKNKITIQAKIFNDKEIGKNDIYVLKKDFAKKNFLKTQDEVLILKKKYQIISNNIKSDNILTLKENKKNLLKINKVSK